MQPKRNIKILHLSYSVFLFIIFELNLRHCSLRRTVKATVTNSLHRRKGLSGVDFGAKPSLKPILTYKSQRVKDKQGTIRHQRLKAHRLR